MYTGRVPALEPQNTQILFMPGDSTRIGSDLRRPRAAAPRREVLLAFSPILKSFDEPADEAIVEEQAMASTPEEYIPCPSPMCDNVPPANDRYCEACGTWLGLDGEKPPTTGPLARALLRNPAAHRIVTMVERAEANLNDFCK
jgi:hypothetical protein